MLSINIKIRYGLSEPLTMGLYEHCSIKQISYVNINIIIILYMQ